MNTTKQTIACVKWIDSSILREQCDPDDIDGYCEIESAGWVVKEDRKCLTLALDRIDSGDVRLVLSIPKKCILDIRRFDVNPD